MLIVCLIQAVFSHRCIHKANYNLTVRQRSDEQDEQDRNLANSYFRLTYDATKLIADVRNKDQLNLLIRTVEVAKLFYINLMVPKNSTIGKIYPQNDFICNYNFTSAQIQDGERNSDFHFYLKTETPSSDQSWIATSEPCMVDNLNLRTVVGVITINLNYLAKMTTSNYDFQSFVDVFIHEMFHSLVFSPSLFAYYINPYTELSYISGIDYNIDTGNDYFIAFPNCIQWAKQYYQCPTINKFPLENNGLSGSAGAHWERTVLQNDIMTASSLIGDNLWSGLNNALILDSGWYTLRTDSSPFSLEDKLAWGKGKGCDFFYNYCKYSKYPEFCANLNENLNSFGQQGLGYCTDKDIYSQCMYVTPYKNQLCIYEDNKFDPILGSILYGQYFSVYSTASRSFQSNLSPNYLVPLKKYFTVCYPFTCQNQNQQISIQLGSIILNCYSDNQVISNVKGFTGQLVCPSSISDFCDKFQSCPDSCSQRGYCISDKCRCVQNIVGLNPSNCDCGNGFFVNSNNVCQACNIQNCVKCTDNQSCTSCEIGYYLSNGQCKLCTKNCLDCNSTGFCIKCRYGYITLYQSGKCYNLLSNSSTTYHFSILCILFSLFAFY